MKLVYPDDRERVRDSAIKILRGESVKPYKYRIIDKEGQIRWLLEVFLPSNIRANVLSLATHGYYRAGIGEEKLEEAYEKNAGYGRNCKLKCSAGWNLPGL